MMRCRLRLGKRWPLPAPERRTPARVRRGVAHHLSQRG